MTLAEALAKATARLASAGVAGAGRDARRLLAHALECDPALLTTRLNEPFPEGAMPRFDAAVAARARHQPVAQIVGYREFYGRRFRVTPDVLDPRPDTETLIEAALTLPWGSVLDLGTGTGCILLTLLAERPGAVGKGLDLSKAALEVARDNAKSLNIAAEFLDSNWFDAVAGHFDLIVSNPPYIAEAELAKLAPDVRDHEPLIALSPGGDGLEAYRQIAAGALAHLTPRGHLVLEIGASQAAAVVPILRDVGFATPTVHRDLNHRDRVIVARAKA